MGYIWYSEEGTWRGRSPPRPLLAVPNVTAHPSSASVPITVLPYNGPLLCGFNEPIKGLTEWKWPNTNHRHVTWDTLCSRSAVSATDDQRQQQKLYTRSIILGDYLSLKPKFGTKFLNPSLSQTTKSSYKRMLRLTLVFNSVSSILIHQKRQLNPSLQCLTISGRKLKTSFIETVTDKILASFRRRLLQPQYSGSLRFLD